MPMVVMKKLISRITHNSAIMSNIIIVTHTNFYTIYTSPPTKCLAFKTGVKTNIKTVDTIIITIFTR